MIWLTWRQHRKQALSTLITLGAVAAVMLPTGLAMHHTFTNSGLAACLTKQGTASTIPTTAPDCHPLSQQFQDQYRSLTLVAIHWALVKFGLLGIVTLVVAAAYASGVSWWSGPLVTNGGGRLTPIAFDVQGIVPIGYTLFAAVALGVFAGTMRNKVLPAMGVTVAGFAVVRLLIEAFARPHYLSPLTARLPINSRAQFNTASGAWIYSNGIINGTGKLVMPNTTISCGGTRRKRFGQRRHPLRQGSVRRQPAVPRPGPRTVLQLDAIQTRQQVLGVPGHRNRHLPRPGRDTALPGRPPHPPHLLTRTSAARPRTR